MACFGLTTPAAEMDYLKTYGYGVARRVVVLKDERTAIRRPSNETYVSKLSPRRRQAYSQALFGDDETVGCAKPESDVVLRLALPDGGELGDRFARAVDEARRSESHQAWQERVITCLRDANVQVPEGDLMQVGRPFLQRLLDLVDSKYTTTSDGSIEYEFSATQAAAVPRRAIRNLRRDEMKAAGIEARCREKAGSGAQDAVDAASAHLVGKFRDDVMLLRSALQRME